MGVDDGEKGFVEPGLHGGRGGFAVAQLFADALEDQDVGVHAHADGEDNAGDTGQSEHRAENCQGGEQDDQVQDQGEHGVGAGDAVVHQHENHDHHEAEDGSLHAVADGVGAERRANGALFEVLDGGGERAGAQDER